MVQKETCPACSQGALEQHSGVEEINYRETPLKVVLTYSVCPNCGIEVITTEQIRTNDQEIRLAYKRAMGLLRGKNVRAIRRQFGLTQKDAAQLFGGGVNAFAKYESDNVVHSKSLDLLLRLAAEDPILVEKLKRINKYPTVVGYEDLQGEATLIHVNSGINWSGNLWATGKTITLLSISHHSVPEMVAWGQSGEMFKDSASVATLSCNLRNQTNARVYKAA